jgi:hypothetical protein
MMLVAPMKLLKISLGAFILGLGVYLGFVFSDRLIPSFGLVGSVVVLVAYLATTLYGLAIFYIRKGFRVVGLERAGRFGDVEPECNSLKDTSSEALGNGRYSAGKGEAAAAAIHRSEDQPGIHPPVSGPRLKTL